MTELTAKERFETGVGTVLFIPSHRMTPEQMGAILNKEQVTASFRNENDGNHQKYLHRSVLIPTWIREIPSGYYVGVEIDYLSLPVSRREIDGFNG